MVPSNSQVANDNDGHENNHIFSDDLLSPNTTKRINIVLDKISKWSELENYGQPLGTEGMMRVVPMKTPISDIYVKEGWRKFSLESFIADQKAKGIDIGMVVDLSNHDKIYSDIGGVTYVKIKTESKKIPHRSTIDRFKSIVTRFLAANPDKYAAVHCSYGFNRTGFVICAYLIEVMGMSVADAVAHFRKCRPPGIKHGWFIEELYRRYEPHNSTAQKAATTGSNSNSKSNSNGVDTTGSSSSSTATK